MKFRIFSHRHAKQILENTPEYSLLYREVRESIENITDERLMAHFRDNYVDALHEVWAAMLATAEK
jgi:hypothetical protein